MFPAELVGLITVEQFNYLSGLAGITSGLIVWLIWSRGL
jgi:hypothetical protein